MTAATDGANKDKNEETKEVTSNGVKKEGDEEQINTDSVKPPVKRDEAETLIYDLDSGELLTKE